MPKLIYRDPESDQEASIEIGEALPEVTIGRNPGNVLRVNNPSISRRHAKIVWEGGECTLHDLDSSNGSYINGNRIRSQVLVDGDRLRIGEFPVDFVDDTDSATAEVSAEMIESVLQDPAAQPQHRRTHLGGFEAEEPQGGFQRSGSGAGPVSQGGPPEAPVEGGFSMGGGSGPSSPASPSDGGFSMGGQSSPGPAFATGGGSPPDVPDDDPFSVGGSEPIELESDVFEEYSEPSADDTAAEAGGFAFGGGGRLETPGMAGAGSEDAEIGDALDSVFGNEPTGAEESAAELGGAPSVSEDDLDTYNAAPDEIAQGLREFSQDDEPPALDQIDVEHAETLADSNAPGIAQLQREMEAVMQERDELLDSLEGEVGDVNAASKMQIERLRAERDRLTEERRNLVRQMGEVRAELEAAPDPDEFDALKTKLAELEDANEEANTDLAESQRVVAEKDQELAELQAQLTETADELQKLRDEYESTSEAAAAFENQQVELGGKLSDVEEELRANSEELEAVRGERDELVEQLDAARQDLQHLENELGGRDQDLESLQNELADRDAKIDDLRRALDEQEAELGALAAQRERLEAELDERPVADEVAELRERNDSLEERAAGLDEELARTRDERDELQATLDDKIDLIETLNERYDRVGADLEAIRSERDTLKEERGAYARETDYLQTERRRLLDENKKLEKKIKKLEKEDKRKKRIFEELSRDLRGLVTENNRLEDRIETLESEIESAPSADAFDTLQSERDAFEKDLEKAQKTIEELEDDSSGLTRDLGKYAEEKEQLEERVKELSEELDELREKAESGEKDAEELESLQSRVQELEGEREELSSELETLRGERDELNDRVEKADEELEELRASVEEAEENSELTEEIEELKKKLSETESTLSELILEKDRLEDELEKAKG